MQNQTKQLAFIAIDGDDVGPKLRSYIIKNDIEGAAHFSLNLENDFQSLRTWLHNRKFTIVFCGGDSILAYSSPSTVNHAIVDLPQGFWPYSVGIGVSAEMAYLALQLAKARGKSQAVTIMDVEAKTIKVWDQS